MEKMTLRIEELADLIDISRAELFRLRKKDPDFPRPIKIGKRVMWFREDIRHYLKGKQEVVA